MNEEVVENKEDLVTISLTKEDHQTLIGLAEGGAYSIIGQLLQKQGSLQQIARVALETLRIAESK